MRGDCALVVLSLASGAALAGNTLTVTFDPPQTPQGPSTYLSAGAEQVLQFGIFDAITFSGGVVLGFPTNFPAVDFATPPNVYASASTDVGADPSLDPIITIDIDEAKFGNVDLVEGLLFNGEITAANFTVRAWNNGVVVDTNVFTNVPPNLSAGNVVFSLTAASIDRVTIEASAADGVWNMLVDTVVFNRVIPAPGGMGVLALAGIAALRRRR